MLPLILGCTLTALGIQIIGWALSVTIFKGYGDKYYDLFGCIGFLAQFVYFVIHTIVDSDGRYLENGNFIFIFVFEVCWCLRLGIFLITRAHIFKGDRRFDEIKKNPIRFAVAYFLQFLWNIITLMPTLIYLSKNPNRFDDFGTNPVQIGGMIICVSGLFIETIADIQKMLFKLNNMKKTASVQQKSDDNTSQNTQQQQNINTNNDMEKQQIGNGNSADDLQVQSFITSGLWSRSRHPNYLGEFMVWIGAFIYVSTQLVEWEFISVLSPIFLVLLISFVSGINKLEQSADKKWGHVTSYQQYKRDAGVLCFQCWKGKKVSQDVVPEQV